MSLSVDVAVIGSGPGGYRAAVMARQQGLTVAIIEGGSWGGTCLNRGCVPKKAWYDVARLIALQSGFATRGIAGTLSADANAAWAHQRRVSAQVRAGYVDYLDRLGIVRVESFARFTGGRQLSVGTQSLSAGAVIVATGSRPLLPPALRIQDARILSTDNLFEQPLPAGRRIAVLGSGAVGTEMTFILHHLGFSVSWLMGQPPMSRSAFSAPAQRLLLERLKACGVVPRTGARVSYAAASGDDGLLLALDDGSRLTVDWVLAGTGRIPNTERLNAGAAGMTLAEGGQIVTDAHCGAADGIYAIGDVSNPAMTANHALADAAVAVRNILKPGSATRDDVWVPEALYSAIELARAGLGEDAAEAEGLEPATGFAAFESNPQALADGEPDGFLRVLADLDSGRPLGVEMAGPGVAELVGLLGPVFGGPDGLSRLAAAAYNHPSRGEECLNAVEAMAARWGLNIPPPDRLG